MTHSNRNEPCACGSGRKAKNCCLRSAVGNASQRSVKIPPLHGAPARVVSLAQAISLAQDFHAAGNRDHAEFIYALVLAADAENGEALFFTGVLRHQESKYQEALQLMLRGLEKLPGVANLHYNIAKLYDDLERLPEAIASYRRAIELNPSHILAHNNLGLALRECGQFDLALASLERATALLPSNKTLAQNLLTTLHYVAEKSPVTIFEMHRQFARQFEQPIATMSPRVAEALNPTPRPLRIGYVSPDFRQHSVAHFMEPVLAAHDKNFFEVFCYYNDTVEDATTARMKNLSQHWRVIGERSDHDAANMIRQDQIDILIDLAGHTNRNSLLAFARKPAPVQATWIGYPNTTGFASMDYRITDALSDPIGVTDALHSEKLIRLPDCFSCYTPPNDSPEVSLAPRKQGQAIMFGSFNYFIKINRFVIETWAKILARVPHSRLTLKYRSLNSESIQEMVRGAFALHGVAPERLILLGNDSSHHAHLERYTCIDIALDPFPYNGTTTTCDALWMGVPVIALAGQSHVSRVGVSQLTTVGLPECIGATRDDYADIAVGLANDVTRLTQLRAELRERLRTSPLMDAARFTRNLEAAYYEMWRTYMVQEQAKEKAKN